MPTNNHQEKLDTSKTHLINFISLLFGFGLAVSSYTLSFFFKEASGRDNVSIFYLVSYIIFLFFVLNLHKIIKTTGKTSSLYLFLFFKLLTLSAILILGPSMLGALFLIFYIIFGNLSWISLNIILETFSSDKLTGRIRGVFMTIMNAGFLLGPALSMSIFETYSFTGIFLTVMLIDFLILVISVFGLHNVKHTYKESFTILQLIRKVRKRKNILRIYYVSFILNFFYATMVIYTPIYFKNIGMSYEDIGIIFTIMLIPFVLFEYPVGRLADKKMGEKEMIIFALMTMSLSTLAIYYIESTSLVVWSIALFITRIGASFIEILRDSYFFKRIDGDDVGVIDFFKTAKPLAYISFAILSSLILSFKDMEIKFVFILLSIVIISGLWPAMRLEDNLSEEELEKLNIEKE